MSLITTERVLVWSPLSQSHISIWSVKTRRRDLGVVVVP